MIQDQKHPDGIWHTTHYNYKGYVITIKSAPGRGIKAHISKDGQKRTTLRYKFINPQHLLTKAKAKVEALIAGISYNP